MTKDPLLIALRERKQWAPAERSDFPLPEDAEKSKAELIRWVLLTVIQDNTAAAIITLASVLFFIYRFIAGLLV